MEELKALVATAISPLIIAIVCQCVGWVLWYRRRSQIGILAVAAGTLLLILGSLSGFSYESRRTQEFLYSPADIEQLPTSPLLIVVLGTGFNPDPQLPPNSQVSPAFTARLLEGVRILKARPESRMLVSVAGKADPASKQVFLNAMLDLIGVDNSSVTLVTTAESTLDEAEAAKTLCNTNPVVLATSASHMPRAMKIFTDAGMKTIAAPTDYGFVRAGSPRDRVWPRWIPSTDGLASNHAWLYEQVATLWQHIRPK
jgi:uncharacterized SAM-binding protein YcdF (DUF218 family)